MKFSIATTRILLTAATALCIIHPATADDSPINPHLQIEAKRVHQSFDAGDSDIDTVTLSPSVSIGYWTLSASASWQHVDGEYFIDNRYPNLAYACNRVNSLSPAAQQFLINRGRLTQQQVQYCADTGGVESATLEDSIQGWNDIEVFANYYLSPLNDYVSGTLGIGYKHDNADYNEGLGTGTRDIFIESGWLLAKGPVSVLATIGYEFILNNETANDLNDYGYVSADARWQFHEVIAAGVEYHYLQASADVLDDLDYAVAYLQLGDGNGWLARLSYTDYLDRTGYPESEYGASLSYLF